jgi:hypothetical protein
MLTDFFQLAQVESDNLYLEKKLKGAEGHRR